MIKIRQFANIDKAQFLPKVLTQQILMKQISAMMTGVVVKILVKPGDQIAEGMDVAILESMKMELPVQAIVGGRVSQVSVKDGDFVNEGDTLLLLE